MKRRPHVVISGEKTTAWVGDRQVSHVHVHLPFLASYKIGDDRTRWTLRPSKAIRMAEQALAAELPIECEHEWSRAMRIGGPWIKMCRRCYVQVPAAEPTPGTGE